ncbi:hypothetical protein QTA58_12045 [Neorhizobium sp. CSC1952]|uniref:hypothetical protein n=1 Tax=Neorhizobium sp. CSC1952 TaxID=2978974 RepID=UPI0025A6816F|nr:hypothetical protein [Rhizobium sp. CSC1952]WJR64986.1 hypothetical protein QTA58_12045 [Rhizobium sp. CSC1952]
MNAPEIHTIACPASDEDQAYAGPHADAGRGMGGAVYDAALAGGLEWMAEKTGGMLRSKRR